MNKSVLAGIVLAAGAATSAFGQIPAYTVETRWVVTPFVDGATSVEISLQGRAIYAGAFPADVTGSNGPRYGNFGIFSLGFGPNGAAQPSTITRTGSLGASSLERGNWGNFLDSDSVPTGDLRGAAVGDYQGTSVGTFRRGFRFFNNTTAALNNATGNGTGGDLANGEFNAAGNLTNFNLLRDDFQNAAFQTRETSATDPAWMNLYRINLVDARGLVAGGNDIQVVFSGWLRSAGQSQRVGGSWTMTGGASVQSSATIAFGVVPIPTPGAAALLGLGGLIVGRRRR